MNDWMSLPHRHPLRFSSSLPCYAPLPMRIYTTFDLRWLWEFRKYWDTYESITYSTLSPRGRPLLPVVFCYRFPHCTILKQIPDGFTSSYFSSCLKDKDTRVRTHTHSFLNLITHDVKAYLLPAVPWRFGTPGPSGLDPLSQHISSLLGLGW